MRLLPSVLFLAFLATVPAANWMIGHVGTCIPNGPCVVPVGFGLSAPAGVLMIGLAMVLRDALHETMGRKWVAVAITVGACLSVGLAPLQLAGASGIAFLLSEYADFAIYEPLRKRKLVLAVLLSGLVGGVVDSAVFLWLAFGSLDFIAGQIVGKTWMAVLAASVITLVRRKEAKPCRR